MKYNLLFALLLLILSYTSRAQIGFEDGYFINDSDEKVQCLIRNRDWKKNPTGFEYKLTKESKVQAADIHTVKEFGISGFSKYIRATVDIDRSGTVKSGDPVSKMSTDRKPVFHEETVFLKVIVDGETPLYYYTDGFLPKYFFRTITSEIRQLVYKRYLSGDAVLTNYDFRYQLYNNFQSTGISMENVKRINYLQKDLERFFIKVNENADDYNVYGYQKKELLNLSIRPGVNSANLEILSLINNSKKTEFENQLNLRLGMEAEFILPFHKNKWAFVIEPTYQYYLAEQSLMDIFTYKVKYRSIELPVGLRHYFFLNKGFKFYINGLYVYDFAGNSEIHLVRHNDTDVKKYDIRPLAKFAPAAGFKIKDKHSLELRYINRPITSTDSAERTKYETLSVIYGYNLF
jgi:hypothetical protein